MEQQEKSKLQKQLRRSTNTFGQRHDSTEAGEKDNKNNETDLKSTPPGLAKQSIQLNSIHDSDFEKVLVWVPSKKVKCVR